MDYLNSDIDTWQESDEVENIKIWRREYDPSTTLCMRMVCKFPNVSPDTAFEVLADIRMRRKWDHRIEKATIIERNDQFVTQYNRLMKVNIPFLAQRSQLIKQYLHKNYPTHGTHFSVAK